MKQELKQFLRETISELEYDRERSCITARLFWKCADKDLDTEASKEAFRVLNIHKNDIRRIDKKLKKLRFLQTEIKKTNALIQLGVVVKF